MEKAFQDDYPLLGPPLLCWVGLGLLVAGWMALTYLLSFHLPEPTHIHPFAHLIVHGILLHLFAIGTFCALPAEVHPLIRVLASGLQVVLAIVAIAYAWLVFIFSNVSGHDGMLW